MGQYKNEVTLTASTYTISQYDEVINVDLATIGGDVTLTLPDIGTFAGSVVGFGSRILIVDESRTITGGTNTITVNASGSDLIDISNTYVFSGENSFSFFVEYVDEGLWTVLVGVDGTSGTSGVDGMDAFNEYCCPDGFDWIPVPGQVCPSFYAFSGETGSTAPTSPVTITADPYSTYSTFGTRLYDSGYNDLGNGTFTLLQTSDLWKNTGSTVNEGPLNRNALWSTSAGNNIWYGFNDCITVPESKTYYIGLAADNYLRFSIDGFTLVDSTNNTEWTPSNQYSFKYWHVYPVYLTEGYHVIEMYGKNQNLAAGFGCEIYNNTATELINATQLSDLDVLFSSATFFNGSFTVVQNNDYEYLDEGYQCPDGWVYDSCSGVCYNIITCSAAEVYGGSSGTSGIGSCVNWTYNSNTTPTGISSGQVRFNNTNITGATEIYIHTDATTGSNDWYGYFKKLVETLCCTLTVRIPSDENSYLIFDYDSSGSTLESTYLKFVVSDTWEAPLLNDSNFPTLTSGDELCLDFDLFKCENTNSASGTGDTISQPCYGYWQYSLTSLSAVTSVNNPVINNVSLNDNGGNGQFTIATTGGTDTSYTLSVGDPIYIHMSHTNYWGDEANAMNIGSSHQVILTQWNQNSTSLTGEIIVIETSTIVNSLINDYIVFGGEITQITDGLTSGIGNNTFFCVESIVITNPPPSGMNCQGGHKFRMGVFDIAGNIQVESDSTAFQFDGIEVIDGEDIGDVSGGGIIIDSWVEGGAGGFGICPPFNFKRFVFSETDYDGNDSSSFFTSLVVGDKFKYQCLGYDPVNSPGDYIIVEVLQPAVAELDESNNTYYRIIGQVINDESDIINCSLFFSKPNNLICVTEVSQIALLPPPPGGNEVVYIVDRIGVGERPSTTGTTAIDSSNITGLSGTTLRVASTDLTGTDNENRLSSTIGNVSLNYLGCEITYEVTDQRHFPASGGIPAYEEITLGDIITNGFDSPRGLRYSASTVTTGNTMYMRFDTSTDGIVVNPGEDRLTTSNGSTNEVVAQPNLKFSGDVLYITAVTQYDTSNFGGDVLQGQIRWNSDWSTFDMGMNENVTQQVGQEQYYYVKNQTGTQIDDGTVVMATGTTGNSGRILVAPAIGDGTIPSRYIMGIATQNIGNGEDGFVTSFGLVKNIDTTGQGGETWNDGDELWVSPTTPGGLTNIEPTEPNLKVSVALVIYAHSNGSIFVRPTFFGRLGDLQNLQTSGETNGDLVVYNSTTDVWEYTKTLKGDYTISGDTTQYGVLYQKSDEVDTTGVNIFTVSSIPTSAGESVFFNYVVKETTSTCMRTGTVMVVSDGVGTQWTDTSTPDINCSTKGVSFDARVSGGNIILRAIVTQGDWNIRVRNEVIF